MQWLILPESIFQQKNKKKIYILRIGSSYSIEEKKYISKGTEF